MPGNKRGSAESISGSEGEDEGHHVPVVIVGGGAAGIGVAHALLRGTLSLSNFLIIESGDDVGTSFRKWHQTTRFISPSFASHPFGPQDLNAIVPDTAVHAFSNGGQHPTGMEYAQYLERMMSGTNMRVDLGNTVTKVQHLAGRTDDEDDVIVLTTSNGNFIICNYLIWAAGDWVNPNHPPTSKFQTEACVHYKDVNPDKLVKSVGNSHDPILLVGLGEAGADLAGALVGIGARKVVILEKQELETDPNLDPSRRLSPVTQERLSRIENHVETKWGCEVLSVKKDGKKNTVTVKDSSGETFIMNTRARVVLCTGFNVSNSKLWQSMFHFTNGSPQVNEFDESTKIPNLFLAGPMLFHKLTATACQEEDEEANGDKKMNEIGNVEQEDDGDEEMDDTGNGKQVENMQISEAEKSEPVVEQPDCDDNDTIIFCFIYKFRTRFAVVAGEVIRRLVRQNFMTQNGKLNEQGEKIFQDVQKMQDFYQSKGMLVTDLSCSTLACGMTTQDTPVYGYESDEEQDENEE